MKTKTEYLKDVFVILPSIIIQKEEYTSNIMIAWLKWSIDFEWNKI